MLFSSSYLARPKVELHLHIDCSVSWTALQRLETGLSFEDFRAKFTAPERCASLKQYLDAIAPSCALLQDARALQVVTEELVAELAQDGVIYAELRFAPHTHLAGGLDLDGVMAAVAQGVRAATDQYAIRVGLILCALRDYSAESNIAVIDLAARWRDRGVVGVDIAGDEAGHPLAHNYATFDRAHDLGLDITAHAGEAAGAESVLEALEKLRPKRIGHGVRCLEDDAVVALLKARDIHLEVCPSSNVQVGVFPSLDQHNVDKLSRRGLSLGINTDARTVAPISLSQEYERLESTFGWGPGEFLAHNLEAARHAFQPDAIRAELVESLLTGWKSPRSVS
ncbi:adenosine deaminase [Loktanella sp. IMCC34160]|uniref:adenosine deaminase n=1 Tax=Loktanella sp. IMCC34160 TaxID=2510646 RepID=UPI00101C632D|nr:adenosine deaminase [Loktanella sp. IMCC34160]RYG89156.1 adenosine deaminase [Loktanella sp. IMCC34160]